MTAITAMTQRMIPAVATRGRLLSMAAVGIFGIAVGIILQRSDISLDDMNEYIAGFGFAIFVPLVALVIATATLGTLIVEKTLAYFCLRPIGRWNISSAAMLAGLIVLVPLILVPMGVIGAVAGEAPSIIGALAGAGVGLVAYLSVFTMLGLFTQRALIWGLVYVLVWEGLVAGFSQGARRLAIRTYARGAMSRISDTEVISDPPTSAVIIIVTVAVALACFAVTTWRLNSMTVD